MKIGLDTHKDAEDCRDAKGHGQGVLTNEERRWKGNH